MILALQKVLAPGESGSSLNLDVVFTSLEPTLAALKKAADLASRLNARITLVVPQVVPYPLPLKTPPVLIDFNERRFRVIASYLRLLPRMLARRFALSRSAVGRRALQKRWLLAQIPANAPEPLPDTADEAA